MIRVSPSRMHLVAALICIMCCWSAAPAGAQLMRKLSFNDLVDRSDQVFVARCLHKKTVLQDGRIVTHYTLMPSEVWKGELNLETSGTLQMEELGGELKDSPIPIGQKTLGMANLVPNEEALLFTAANKEPKPHKTKMGRTAARAMLTPGKPHVVGAWQGRYTIMRHPLTKEALVARASRSMVAGAPIEPDVQKMMVASNPGTALVDADQVLKLQRMAKDIQRTADKARADRDARARKTPAEADAVYQFEPLDKVRERVLKRVDETRRKTGQK